MQVHDYSALRWILHAIRTAVLENRNTNLATYPFPWINFWWIEICHIIFMRDKNISLHFVRLYCKIHYITTIYIYKTIFFKRSRIHVAIAERKNRAIARDYSIGGRTRSSYLSIERLVFANRSTLPASTAQDIESRGGESDKIAEVSRDRRDASETVEEVDVGGAVGKLIKRHDAVGKISS